MYLNLRIIGDINIDTEEEFEYLRKELENINLTDLNNVIRVETEALRNFLIISLQKPVEKRRLLLELLETIKDLNGIEEINILN